MNRSLALDDLSIGILLALTHVPFDHTHTLNNDPLLLAGDGNNPAALAFIGAGDHYHFVVLLYMKPLHNLSFCLRGSLFYIR